jgi:hypothetical protein
LAIFKASADHPGIGSTSSLCQGDLRQWLLHQEIATAGYGADIGQDARKLVDNACEAALTHGDHSARQDGLRHGRRGCS